MVGLAASVRRNTGVHAGHPPQRPTRMPTLGASELQSQFLPRGQALPHCEYQRDCRKQRCGAQHSRPARPHWPNSGTQEAVLVATARAWAPRFMDGLVQQQRQVRDGGWPLSDSRGRSAARGRRVGETRDLQPIKTTRM